MITVLTDRSRIVAFRNCPRLRYWNYHHGGMGIVPVGASLPLTMGSAFHDVVAKLRVAGDPALVIDAAGRALRAELGVAYADSTSDGTGLSPEFIIDEQVRLLEGLCWAWVRIRLPLIQEEFEPVVIERELLWEMGFHIPIMPSGKVEHLMVTDMVRCDVLERRRADGLLFYREYKTTSSGDEEWAKQFDTSTQMLANLLAVRETLHEEIAGVIIEGVIKGSRSKDRNKTSPFLGQRIQQSVLCYGYVPGSGLGGGYSEDWVRGWIKTPTWTLMNARDLVFRYLDEATCRAMFSPVPPIIPREEHLQRWRKQAVYQEGQIWHALSTNADLDHAFPMNDDHCHRYFGSPCAYKDCCFDPVIGADPLRSGLYVPRTPHHPTELRSE